MFAAEQGRESVIKLLIDCGSDRSALTKVKTHAVLLQKTPLTCFCVMQDGKTAMEIAKDASTKTLLSAYRN
jgi:hypothetical protein